MELTKKSNVNLIDCLITISLLWFNGGLMVGLSFFNATVNLIVFFICLCGIVVINRKAILEIYKTGFFYGLSFLIVISVSMLFVIKSITLDFWYILYALILLVYFQYLKYRPSYVQKGIQRIILADRIIVNVYTCYLLNSNPMLSRIFAQGGEMVEKEGYDTFLLASYGFVYSTVILLTYLFFDRDLWSDSGKFDQIFIAIYAVTSVMLVTKAAYAIAIVTMILFIVLSFMLRRNKPLQSTFNVVLLILGIFCFAPLVLDFLANTVFEGSIVAQRFNEIISAMAGDISSSNDISVRFSLLKKTLTQLMETPLFGVFEQGDDVNYLLGRHTEWVDSLAKFGVFRYALWIVFCTKAVRETIKKRKSKRAYRGVAVCIALLGFLNPILSEDVLLVMFIVIPFVFSEENNYGRRLRGKSDENSYN